MDGINGIADMWQTRVEGKRTIFCPTYMPYVGKRYKWMSIPVTWQVYLLIRALLNVVKHTLHLHRYLLYDTLQNACLIQKK